VKNKKATPQSQTAAEMGEHRIIELMRSYFDVMPDMPVPFGDDVSAVPVGEGNVAVLKADMLVAATDIPREMSRWQAARKAVVINASDFAAKGVQPRAAMVSLGLPPNVLKADLEALAKGLNAGARENGAYVVGGDTGEACDLIISVQLYGIAEKGGLMLRSGAKTGDILAVTGEFGRSAAGLRLLQNPKCKAQRGTRKALAETVLLPKARLAEGLALAHCGAVSASMDSSDGLAWCLHELAAQSCVGFAVDYVPIAKDALGFAELNELDAADLALHGGEEYELIVTVKPQMWREAESAVASVGGKLLPIGKATAQKRVVLKIGGKEQLVEPRGFEHFKS
jgi:thiamine-monophosphate kinase